MHLRNRYRVPPSFRALAAHDRAFAEHVREDGSIDVDSEAAKRALTVALLRRDFGVACTLLPSRLCPALPNRLNYLHWMEDILAAWHPCHAPPREMRGVDVGTGSVAVYAVLLCVMHRNWRMLGTDTDAEAIAHAQRLVDENAATLGSRVTLRLVPADAPLIPADAAEFTLCNPPFYASRDERDALRDAKHEAHAQSDASDAELYTPGGEQQFVARLVEESLAPENRERIACVPAPVLLTQLVHIYAGPTRVRRGYRCAAAAKQGVF